MRLHVRYHSTMGCYCLHRGGQVICLGSDTLKEAKEEARQLIDAGQVV